MDVEGFGCIDHKLTYLIKISKNNNIASDTALLSPGSAVVDLSALEGTTDDELAMSQEMSFKVKVPLYGDKVACPVCKKREEHLFFMTLSDLDKHLSLYHIDTCIEWVCTQCRRGFPKLHGARCHLPKCKGTSINSEGSFKCKVCPMSFGTQRGLSTHERHGQPAVRNEKGRGTDPQTLDFGQ